MAPVTDAEVMNCPLLHDLVRDETGMPRSRTEARHAAHVASEVLTRAGQRRVNLLWESTQAVIALAVVGATIYSNYLVSTIANPALARELTANQLVGLTHLNVMSGLVIGFYFGRTNHTRSSRRIPEDDTR